MSESNYWWRRRPNRPSGEHRSKKRFGRGLVAFVGVMCLVAAATVVSAAAASATKPSPEHKVTICHRTDSETNPYVQITVDVSAVDGNTSNDHGQGDHLAEHTGDVWYPGHPKEPKWGDIIPPFYSDGTPDGLPSLNWNAAGQAIFNNGCKPVETPPPPTQKPGTATATSGACSNSGEASGTAEVDVTNTADDTHKSVTYTATLHGVVKEVTVADGATGSVTFSGLAPGNYDWTVTGPDGTDASGTVTVDQCETPPPGNQTVTPAAPTHTTPTCDNPTETVTPSTQEGVIWSPEGPTVLKPGDTVTYTASPAKGYEFPEGAQTSWTFTNNFHPSKCKEAQKGKNLTTTASCGQVTFGNPNGFDVFVYYGAKNSPAPDNATPLKVPANGSALVHTKRTRLYFQARGASADGSVYVEQSGTVTVPQNCGHQPPPGHHHGHKPPAHHGHKGHHGNQPGPAPTTPTTPTSTTCSSGTTMVNGQCVNQPGNFNTGASTGSPNPWLPIGGGAALVGLLTGLGYSQRRGARRGQEA